MRQPVRFRFSGATLAARTIIQGKWFETMQSLPDSPAQIIRRLLIDLGLGVVASYAADVYTGSPWPVFDAGEPDKPDNCLTVTDTLGIDIGQRHFDGRLVQFYGVQVRIRGTTHPVGWLKADAIRNTLAESVFKKIVHVGANNYLVWSMARVGQVLSLGTNVPGDKRKLFTINATSAIEQL
jgi:hypothetical protein